MVKSVKITIYKKGDYTDQDILALMRDFSRRYSFVPNNCGRAEYLAWGQYLQAHLNSTSATQTHLIAVSKKIWKHIADLKLKNVKITIDDINKFLILESIKNSDKSNCDVCGKLTTKACTCESCQAILDTAS